LVLALLKLSAKLYAYAPGDIMNTNSIITASLILAIRGLENQSANVQSTNKGMNDKKD
jgi:hypothetical protein